MFLLGKAIKYAGLKAKEVRIVPSSRSHTWKVKSSPTNLAVLAKALSAASTSCNSIA
jgi:hypothetical protein